MLVPSLLLPPHMKVGTYNFLSLSVSVRVSGRYGISRGRAYSGLMFANFTTLPHFSVSSAMSLPKSAGESASTVPPKSAMRALITGVGEARVHFLIERTDDRSGSIPRRTEPEPCARLVARYEVAHDRNFGQHVGARRGGHG